MHAVVICYLLVTACGTFYAFTRIFPPVIPHAVTFFSYGLMAPYQSYAHFAFNVAAEGRSAGGEWQTIDLTQYQPLATMGERLMRMTDHSFGMRQELIQPRYRDAANQLLRLENEKGKNFESVRLTWEQWPLSPAGYWFLHHDPFIERRLLMQVP